MSRTRFEIDAELTVDARRAAWFPASRVLAVADLHLGYAWAHRASGQLMPITAANDTNARLRALQLDYQPQVIAMLGDIVHRAVNVHALEAELRELVDSLSAHSRLVFLAGNHDRNLQKMLKEWALPIELAATFSVGESALAHGDVSLTGSHRRLVMGHEHPAISIGDGVTTSQKCPCFLISRTVVVLPAFSRWAAGTNVRAYPFMSEAARSATFTRAIAICGDKLLPIPL